MATEDDDVEEVPRAPALPGPPMTPIRLTNVNSTVGSPPGLDQVARKNGWHGYRTLILFLSYFMEEDSLVLLYQ